MFHKITFIRFFLSDRDEFRPEGYESSRHAPLLSWNACLFKSIYAGHTRKYLGWPLYGPNRHLLVEVTSFYCFYKPEVLPFMTGSVKYLYLIQRTRIDRKTCLSYVFQCFRKTGSTSGHDRKLKVWPKNLSNTNYWENILVGHYMALISKY